jgi:hypothetical protein
MAGTNHYDCFDGFSETIRRQNVSATTSPPSPRSGAASAKRQCWTQTIFRHPQSYLIFCSLSLDAAVKQTGVFSLGAGNVFQATLIRLHHSTNASNFPRFKLMSFVHIAYFWKE